MKKLWRRGIVHYSPKNSEEYAQDIASSADRAAVSTAGLQQPEPSDSSAAQRRQTERANEGNPQAALLPNQEAVISLTQAQCRLSKEIEHALQKLRQVITESETLVNHMKQNQD